MGDAVGGVVVAQLALGADDPLSERGFSDEEGARDLGGVEPAEEPQGESDLGVGGEGGMAAQEHQSQLIVRHDIDEAVEVVELGVVVAWQVVGFESEGRQVAVGAGRFASQPVDGAVAGGGGDPAAGVRRHTLCRPLLGGDGERVGHRVLGEVDVAEDADQSGGAAAGFGAKDRA